MSRTRSQPPAMTLGPLNLRSLLIGLGVIALSVAVDQATKAWALATLDEGVIDPLLGDVLSLQLVFNPGAAFSLGEEMTWVITVIQAVVIAAILACLPRLARSIDAAVLGLLAGGAIGNFIDRMTRPPGTGVGHVVDFINYNGWFVGNIADIFVVVGVIGLAVLLWLGHGDAATTPAAGAGDE